MKFSCRAVRGAFLAIALVGCGAGTGGAGAGGTGGDAGGGGASSGGRKGTDGGRPGIFTTAVNSGTKLTDLSSAQATQLCNDFNAYAQTDVLPVLCKFDTLSSAHRADPTTDSALQAECTLEYNNCLAYGGPTVFCDPLSTPSTCTLTVGDLATCLNTQDSIIEQLPNCDALTEASLAALFPDGGVSTANQPAICVPFLPGGSCYFSVSVKGLI